MLLTEDIRCNNGLIFEDKFTPITITATETPDKYPFIIGADNPQTGCVFPTEHPDIKAARNKDNLYKTLNHWIKISDDQQIVCDTKTGGYNTKNPKSIEASSDVTSIPVNVAYFFKYKKDGVEVTKTLKDLQQFARKLPPNVSNEDILNMQVWEDAIRNIDRDLIIPKMPELVFPSEGYTAIKNDAGMVLLMSDRYAEGLYVMPSMIKIDMREVPWQDAVNIFGKRPELYVNLDKPEIERRIRLRFRKFIVEKTKQGVYVDRRGLDPNFVIMAFDRSKSIEDFINQCKTAEVAI